MRESTPATSVNQAVAIALLREFEELASIRNSSQHTDSESYHKARYVPG
jgi:hypothetical protein